MARIDWPIYVLDLLAELPARDADLIFEKVRMLERFPRMYPIRIKGRFRRYRWLLAGRWLVFHRVIGDIVYIRGVWPSQIP